MALVLNKSESRRALGAPPIAGPRVIKHYYRSTQSGTADTFRVQLRYSQFLINLQFLLMASRPSHRPRPSSVSRVPYSSETRLSTREVPPSQSWKDSPTDFIGLRWASNCYAILRPRSLRVICRSLFADSQNLTQTLGFGFRSLSL